MKFFIVLLLVITNLTACNNSSKNAEKASDKKDPIAKTINQQEVSRIALVEASQFIQNAKEKGLDFSSGIKTYNQAMAAYNNGHYKQAQVLAVKSRHLVEELLHKK